MNATIDSQDQENVLDGWVQTEKWMWEYRVGGEEMATINN